MTIPTHLIMVINRDTCDLKLVSAHLAGEAEAAFANLSALFASTPNDVHKVTVPSECGFVIGEIVSSPRDPTTQTGVNHYCAACRTKLISEQEPCPICTRKPMIAVSEKMPSTFTVQGQTFHVQPEEKSNTNGIKRNDRGEYVQRLSDGSEIISVNDFSD
jgi:hypothetical protein